VAGGKTLRGKRVWRHFGGKSGDFLPTLLCASKKSALAAQVVWRQGVGLLVLDRGLGPGAGPTGAGDCRKPGQPNRLTFSTRFCGVFAPSRLTPMASISSPAVSPNGVIWCMVVSSNEKGPARGNPPGGGPLLIPEQALQALPVPDRRIPMFTTSAARFQREFLDTSPSPAGAGWGTWGLDWHANPLHCGTRIGGGRWDSEIGEAKWAAVSCREKGERPLLSLPSFREARSKVRNGCSGYAAWEAQPGMTRPWSCDPDAARRKLGLRKTLRLPDASDGRLRRPASPLQERMGTTPWGDQVRKASGRSPTHRPRSRPECRRRMVCTHQIQWPPLRDSGQDPRPERGGRPRDCRAR
jgi:hypothetical protein